MAVSELEYYFLRQVNAARAQEGAAPLLMDDELVAAGRVQSAWLDQTEPAGGADPHVGPGGSRPEQRIQGAGYGATRTGENVWFIWGDGVALNTAAVDALHGMLMQSPGHHANIVAPEFRDVGIALQSGDYQGHPAVFVTEDFGTPTAAEALETDKSSGNTPPPPPPGWQRFELAPPGSASTRGGIEAVSRVPDSMEVWWTAPDGSVWDAF
jgi:Cysteine-rich secretory protein family